MIVEMKAHPSARVPLVDSYQHVGCIFQSRPGFKMDVAKHAQMCDATCSRLKPYVLSSSKVPVILKSIFAEGCAFSRLFATANVWHNLSQETLRRLEKPYNRVLRSVYGEAYSEVRNPIPMSDVEFYKKYEIPNVSACIKVRRLRLLARSIKLAPPLLLKMLGASADYADGLSAAMVADLAQVWAEVACLTQDMPDPREPNSGAAWSNLVRTKGAKFKDWIKIHSSSFLSPLPVPAEPPSMPLHVCPECSKSFTFQAIGTHMFRAHGKKNEVRQLVEGTICLACLKDFNTRSKLLHHVSFRCKNCKDFYQYNILPMSEETFDKAEKETAKCRASLKALGRSPLYSHLPVKRLCGPVPPPPSSHPNL